MTQPKPPATVETMTEAEKWLSDVREAYQKSAEGIAEVGTSEHPASNDTERALENAWGHYTDANKVIGKLLDYIDTARSRDTAVAEKARREALEEAKAAGVALLAACVARGHYGAAIGVELCVDRIAALIAPAPEGK